MPHASPPCLRAALTLALLLACGDGPADPDAGRAAAPDGGAADAGPARADAGRPRRDAGPGSVCEHDRVEDVARSPLGVEPGATSEEVRAGAFRDVYLRHGGVSVAVRREWGASIVFFGPPGRNTIDANDTGREVQVALYDPTRQMQGCAHDASCEATPTPCPASIRYLGWNPVQGGNRCNDGSPVESIRTSEGTLRAMTRPLQWNPDWDHVECSGDGCDAPGAARREADVRLTQTLAFVRPGVLELTYDVENLADVDHPPTVQEMPTLYTSNGRAGPDLWRLFDAGGREVPIDRMAGGEDGFFHRSFDSPEPWVTLQDDDAAFGVALLYEAAVTSFQGWQNRALPFNNVRALFRFGLPARGTVSARAYLLVGGLAEVSSAASALLREIPPFGVLDAPGESADAGAVAVSGWALDNRGVASVAVHVDEGAAVPLTYGVARPDVCRVWPGYAGCDAVGYAGTVELAADGCPHLIEIVATDVDGNARTIARRAVTVR